MPTVPKYEADITTQPIRTGGISGGAAIPNVQVQQFDAFKGVQDIAIKAYEKEITDANNLAVTEAVSSLNDAVIELNDKAKKNKGRDSIGIEDKITAEYDGRYKEIEDMLSNEAQKETFKINGLKIRNSFRSGLTTYEREESFRYKQSVFDTAIKSHAESASISAPMFADNVMNGIVVIDKAAKEFGWDDKQTERNRMLFRTQATDKRIKSLIVSDKPEEAEVLLKTMTNMIDPDTVSLWKEKLSKLSSDEKVISIGNELWRNHFNEQTGVFKYFDASADAIFTGQPKRIQDEIDQYLRSKDNKFKEQRKQETESNLDIVYRRILEGKEIKKEQAYLDLNGEKQRLMERVKISYQVENASDVIMSAVLDNIPLGKIEKDYKAEYDTVKKYKPELLITLRDRHEVLAQKNMVKQLQQDTFNKIIESKDSVLKVTNEDLMILQSQNLLSRGQVNQIQQYKKKYDFRVFNVYKNLISKINGFKFSEDKNEDTALKVKLRDDVYNTMLLSGTVDENSASLVADEIDKKILNPLVSDSLIDKVKLAWGKKEEIFRGVEQRKIKVQQPAVKKPAQYEKPPDAGSKEWQGEIIVNPSTKERMKSVKSGNKWIWKKLTGATGGF